MASCGAAPSGLRLPRRDEAADAHLAHWPRAVIPGVVSEVTPNPVVRLDSFAAGLAQHGSRSRLSMAWRLSRLRGKPCYC
eukprot:246981-Alexandrium_andersonii.AAC.1